MADSVVRVLIADDDPAVREALVDLLSDDPGLDLVGVAADVEDAIRLAIEKRPAVALLDARMPGGGGARAAREITQRCPATFRDLLKKLADYRKSEGALRKSE